jgi:ADP-ribose pyrophosphatase
VSERDRIVERTVAYTTPWFRVTAKRVRGESAPFYSLETHDYAAIVATTALDEFVLVRQFRPAVEQVTLELPSGHVDPGLSAEQAARQELREETGYDTESLRLLGVLNTDVGRMANRMWCFWARDVQPIGAGWRPEAGIQVEVCSRPALRRYIEDGTFNHALHLAALMLASVGADSLVP